MFDLQLVWIFFLSEGDRAVIRLEVVTESLGADKHNTSDRQFAAETNIFMIRDPFSQSKGVDQFLRLLKRTYLVNVGEFGFGCLEIRMKCPTSESFEKLLENHSSGKLDEIAKSCLFTETQLKADNLKTFITDDYNHPCSKSFPKVVKQSRGGAGPGAVETIIIKSFLDMMVQKWWNLSSIWQNES